MTTTETYPVTFKISKMLKISPNIGLFTHLELRASTEPCDQLTDNPKVVTKVTRQGGPVRTISWPTGQQHKNVVRRI